MGSRALENGATATGPVRKKASVVWVTFQPQPRRSAGVRMNVQSEDWDDDAWKDFSQDHRVEIRFQRLNRGRPDELRGLARTVVLRFAREGDSAPHSRQVARGLVNTALRTRSPRKKIALLRTALARDAVFPPHVSNWPMWSFSMATGRSASPRMTKSSRARRPVGRSGRPSGGSMEGPGFFSVQCMDAQWRCGTKGATATPLSQLEALLSLNPSDNQGVRFFIPLLLLLGEDTESASRYFEAYAQRYPHDYPEPSFLFGWALCLAFAGDEFSAREKYREAMLRNIYIAPMLLEEPEPPRGLWQPNERAEPNYAAEFIDSYAVLWDREAGASRILRECWQELQPRIGQILTLRERMADFQDQR